MINKRRYDFVAIGERIIKERLAAGYKSQDALIEALDTQCNISIGRNSLSDIENGKGQKRSFSIGLLSALADLFNCEIGYILCEEGYEQRSRYSTDVYRATGLTQDALAGLLAIQKMDDTAAKAHILHADDPDNYPEPDHSPFLMDMLNILLSNYAQVTVLLQWLWEYCIMEPKTPKDYASLVGGFIAVLEEVKNGCSANVLQKALEFGSLEDKAVYQYLDPRIRRNLVNKKEP